MPTAESRPNILFLLTDNQRHDLMRCAGNPIIETPNLDRLGRDGVRFERAFATTPICAASRASIFTGLYERRHEFTFRTAPLRTEFSHNSYPALLRESGYHTGFIGKFGIESDGLEAPRSLVLEDETETLRRMFDHFEDFHWSEKGYVVEQPDGRAKHLTDLTSDKAIRFLRTSAEKPDQPFCLSISFNAPHADANDPQQYIWPEGVDGLYDDAMIPEPANSAPDFFAALPDFIRNSMGRDRWPGRFDTPEKTQRMMKGLYRMVSGVDRAIGTILEELERLSMADNTIVIFSSDHGMFYGERGLCDCWLLNEEPLRVPLIVYDPRAVASRGTTRDEMALNIDIAPTILDLAGLPIPGSTQGQSLLPLLTTGDADVNWRLEFFCEHLFDHVDIPKSEGVRTERWKYIRYFEQQPVYEELYDLKSDPLESVNLVDDGEYAEQLHHLRDRCDRLREEVAEG